MGPETPTHHEERYQPLALVGVTLIALLGFAVFFLSFLVAPLAILMIFFVGFSASDRSKRTNGNGNGHSNPNTSRLAQEAEARRHVIERSDEEQTPPAASLSRVGV
jgi:hypothetical protein